MTTLLLLLTNSVSRRLRLTCLELQYKTLLSSREAEIRHEVEAFHFSGLPYNLKCLVDVSAEIIEACDVGGKMGQVGFMLLHD